jgi:sugar-specific transcriptional regulator TrmB
MVPQKTNIPPTNKQINVADLLPRWGRLSEGVEVLSGLGLSTRQARVYLTLLKLGDVAARVVSDFTGIERQEVYRIVGELERLGLVKRCLTLPNVFSALPAAEGVELLIERRLDDLNHMTKRAINFTNKLSQTPLNPCDAALSFGEVLEATRGKRLQSAIEASQHRVQAVVGAGQFRQLCFHYEEALLGAIERGVMVEVLSEMPPVHCLPQWVKDAMVKYPNFKFKSTPESPSAAFVVFDGTQAVIVQNPNSSLTKGPQLWTTHPALVAPCQAYFWEKWDRCEFGDG